MQIHSGVITALITPFLKDGEVDFTSLQKLIDFQFQNGVKQFVVNGTTAESPTLTKNEIKSLVSCVRSYNPTINIILGTGSNSTKKTVEMTKWAEELGVDGALVVVPYYNKPTQEGMMQHYRAVAKEVSLPIVMYNVPGRTVVSMDAKTAIDLSAVNNIIGTKEASGNIEITKDIKKGVDPDWLIFSGDDETCLDLCLSGGHGVISVISHVIPKEIINLISKSINKDKSCLQGFEKYSSLLKYLFIEPNPVPVKKALQLMGVIEHATVRLPLVEMSDKNSSRLKEILQKLELI